MLNYGMLYDAIINYTTHSTRGPAENRAAKPLNPGHNP